MAPHADRNGNSNGSTHPRDEDETHPSIFAPLEPGLSDAAAKKEMPRFPS